MIDETQDLIPAPRARAASIRAMADAMPLIDEIERVRRDVALKIQSAVEAGEMLIRYHGAFNGLTSEGREFGRASIVSSLIGNGYDVNVLQSTPCRDLDLIVSWRPTSMVSLAHDVEPVKRDLGANA